MGVKEVKSERAKKVKRLGGWEVRMFGFRRFGFRLGRYKVKIWHNVRMAIVFKKF